LSFEVVYTSSPRGLRDGDRGFCTVAATPGIPRKLQETLESLSGYRHAFAASSSDNPVNYAYAILQIQREPHYVLSRIADAGNDYSGRGNKMAHHLALSAEELRRIEVAPHALLADPRFWFKQWNREPQALPAGRMPQPHKCGAAACGTWQAVFGDAGWAGMLAGAVQQDPQPVFVILPSGRGSLALVAEALSLVSRRDHWKICFSTYYTRAVAGTKCHWRFLLDGTAEADAARAKPAGILVDPAGGRQRPPDDDPYVQAARGEDVDLNRAAEPVVPDRMSRGPMTKSQMRRRQAGARARRARLAASRRPVARREVRESEFDTPVAPTRRARGTWFWVGVGGGTLVVAVGVYLLAQLLM